MKRSRRMYRACLIASALLALAAPLHAQETLDGLARVNQWTDFENQTGELPTNPFGTCDQTNEDRVGIRVQFQNGTTASATYSGVAALWNTENFDGIDPDTSSGFLASCTGLHFLFNNGTSLPMAWENCSMPFSGNFDLDYINANGSHFRADTTGWVQATFQTYCGTAVPAMPHSMLLALAALILAAAATVLKRRTRASASA